jgi:predicted 3-demethylubiquinone-9 3-methyltransferase (glyoxalase superfamily)
MDSALDHKVSLDEGVSLMINCDGQQEVDRYREALTADGGVESQCGWCKDKYGVSRQVAPKQALQVLFQKEKTKADHAMQAMMKMKKIVIEELEA